MADDNRRDGGDRFYGREEWRGGPGGGQRGESFHTGAGQPGQGQNHDQGGYGQTYGQAGGYNPGPGRSYGAFESGGAGSAHGQGGMTPGRMGQQAQGQQSYGGGYTGQTGTGYGQTMGGGQGREEAGRDPGLLDRARHAVSGVLGGGEGQHGPHRGRGPKNYSRSDDRVRDDVNDRLTDDPFLDATHIEVTVQEGEVTLSGTVTARPDKRRAEDLADNVSGVKHVQNNLRVQEAGADQNSGRDR